VQVVKRECLDKFIAFGREHLDLLCQEYAEHYHAEQPRQAKGNLPLVRGATADATTGEVMCRERLGGVLRHYARAAA